MDKNEERVRNTTLVQLWNDEIIDRERIDTGEMSEAEVRERAEFWHQAAELYRDRARQMEEMVKHLQKTKLATERCRYNVKTAGPRERAHSTFARLTRVFRTIFEH